MNIATFGALETLEKIQKKEINCLEIVQEFIKKAKEDKFNAFITTTFDLALEQAKEEDENISKFGIKKLSGIVCGIKDAFCTKGIKTTCGSKILENFIPQYESTTTEKLWQNGGILIGKTNMDEFSMESSGKTSYFGPTENPLQDKTRLDEKLVPGGSSSGSATAVKANYCHIALGGDTGGSVKQPASFCGIVGVRPTYGRNSRHGLISYASSLDQPGIFAKNVNDAAYILEIISGQDSKDSTMLRQDSMKILEYIQNIPNLNGMTIGIPIQCKSDKILDSVNQIWENVAKFFEKKGAKIKEISIPNMEIGVEVYYSITTAEAFSNLARFDGIKFGYRAENFKKLDELYELTRTKGFGPEVQRRIMTGCHVLSHENYEKCFIKAAKIRNLLCQNFQKAFEEVNILLCPTSPGVAFGINDEISIIQMYLEDILTIPSNLAGLAGISIPSGFDNITGLPIGMQLIPKSFDEITMFKFAKILENGVFNNEIL